VLFVRKGIIFYSKSY